MYSSEPAPASEPWWATPGVGRAQVDVVAEVRQLSEAFAAGADLAPAGSQLVGLREHIDQLESVFLRAVADFDASGGFVDDGAGSLAAWLRHHCRLAPGEAASRARLARAVTSGPMKRTGQAMRDGVLSWRHAEAVERTLRDVPVERREEAEEALLEPAKSLDPVLLKRVGAQQLHRLDVDRAEAAAVRRLERRGLSLAETLDGMVAVSGLLDPVTGATVMTALDALTRPPTTGGDDLRSWPQRRADALGDICRQWLELGPTPEVAG